MMYKGLRFNFYTGLSGALFVIFLSSVRNGWTVSLMRGIIGFILFFAAAYWFRFAMTYVIRETEKQSDMPSPVPDEKGGHTKNDTSGQQADFEPYSPAENFQLAEDEAQKVSRHIKEMFKEDDKPN
ncbi:hypothetical protein [Bacillus marinisedimentorum]|uniref:hypothetical protein n=1 Tax=Bacillus marinisedimentorum TaxID=1821260 RepID=UPI0007DF316D|nr:hypothetical protein [Bacillus marinisedimentorum]